MLLCCTALSAGTALAQNVFVTEPPPISTTNNAPVSLKSVDLDGDGDLDMLIASRNDQRISWYPNDGTGRFGGIRFISEEVRTPSDVAAADLDGDGDLDVVSSSFTDRKIAWYRNDGTGTFGPQQIILSDFRNAQAVGTADLDGDGDLDIVAGASFDEALVWLRNDGTGQFSEAQPMAEWGRHTRPESGRFRR